MNCCTLWIIFTSLQLFFADNSILCAEKTTQSRIRCCLVQHFAFCMTHFIKTKGKEFKCAMFIE